MKFRLHFIMMAATLFMAACGSDDDDSTPNLAQDIAGTYKGYTVAEFKYTAIPMTTPGESISLAANENGTCNISFESGQWGKFTMSDAVTSLKNNVYTVEGSGKTLMGMDPASQKEYECTIEGTISKDKKTVSFVFNVPSVMGGLKITFTLGDAPANKVIAGVYEGSLDLSVSGQSVGTEDESKVTIKNLENEKVEVTLAAFSTEGGMGFSDDIVINDVEVAAVSDGSYTVSATIDTTSGSTKVTGSMEGTIKEGKAAITFLLKPGAMPMFITATFASK
ncbi:MAG: calycin-like domain-containing protein [Tannerellaceae bacterium]|jgi:hypothetical protein|nr:calycin-like domain-containing protein [Tannerellaceae bacterium]